jgi:hypothetical protein
MLIKVLETSHFINPDYIAAVTRKNTTPLEGGTVTMTINFIGASGETILSVERMNREFEVLTAWHEKIIKSLNGKI